MASIRASSTNLARRAGQIAPGVDCEVGSAATRESKDAATRAALERVSYRRSSFSKLRFVRELFGRFEVDSAIG